MILCAALLCTFVRWRVSSQNSALSLRVDPVVLVTKASNEKEVVNTGASIGISVQVILRFTK